MRHVEGAEVDILFVPCLDFGPYNFAVCGQLRLGVSKEAFFGRCKYTPASAISCLHFRFSDNNQEVTPHTHQQFREKCQGLLVSASDI